MQKLLVTGGTGFVGRYVVAEAFKKSYEIHLIVRNPQKAKALFGQKVKIHLLDDFNRKEQIAKILENVRPHYVIHLIGIIREIKNRGVTFEKVHYEYSKSIYEALKDFQPEKVIHMSALGVDEKAPSRYHITKLKAEKELIKTRIPFVILRPSLIVGPEQLLFLKLKQILKKLPLLILPEIPDYYFQPVDVRDVAECFIKAIEYPGQGIFELCGDEKVSLGKMMSDFVREHGKHAIFLPLPGFILKLFAQEQYKMMWTDNICGCCSKALPIQEILGRQPTPYRESIRWTAQF